MSYTYGELDIIKSNIIKYFSNLRVNISKIVFKNLSIIMDVLIPYEKEKHNIELDCCQYDINNNKLIVTKDKFKEYVDRMRVLNNTKCDDDKLNYLSIIDINDIGLASVSNNSNNSYQELSVNELLAIKFMIRNIDYNKTNKENENALKNNDDSDDKTVNIDE